MIWRFVQLAIRQRPGEPVPFSQEHGGREFTARNETYEVCYPGMVPVRNIFACLPKPVEPVRNVCAQRLRHLAEIRE